MIGAILSMKYVGKKPWIASIIFWVGYIIAAVAGAIFTTANIPVLSLIISVGVFLALAHYWYKFSWEMSFKLFVVAFIIDLILVAIIAAILLAFAVTIPGMNFIPQFSIFG
jgi:hypothetical protein